jgi:hypothetical protein
MECDIIHPLTPVFPKRVPFSLDWADPNFFCALYRISLARQSTYNPFPRKRVKFADPLKHLTETCITPLKRFLMQTVLLAVTEVLGPEKVSRAAFNNIRWKPVFYEVLPSSSSLTAEIHHRTSVFLDTVYASRS